MDVGYRKVEGLDNELHIFRPCLSAWIRRSVFALPFIATIAFADFRGSIGFGTLIICCILLGHIILPLFLRIIVSRDYIMIHGLFNKTRFYFQDIKEIASESGYYQDQRMRALPLCRVRIVLTSGKIVRFGSMEYSLSDLARFFNIVKNRISKTGSKGSKHPPRL
ncbi:MAG: hypothetical protein RLZZ517_221 [Candidatus Parcubacteria bacterium]